MKEQDNIENFFRKRLVSHEFPFQESNWKKMEEKLDNATLPSSGQGTSWPGLKVVAYIALAGSIVFSVLWFTRELPIEKIPTINVTAEVNIPPPGDDDKEQESPPSGTSGSVLKDTTPAGIIHVDKAGNLTEIQNTGNKEIKNITSREVFDSEPTAPVSLQKAEIQPGNTPSRPDEAINIHEVDPVAVSNDTSFPVRTMNGKTTIPMKRYSAQPISGIDNRHLSRPINTISAGYENTSSSVPMPERSFISRWSGSISLAPDLTGTGLFNRKSVSPIIGARLWFAVTDRWTLSAGALYNTKKYFTNPDEYTPPEGYWENKTNNILPASIFGECTVLDIPVMVSYRITSRERLNLSASAGMSNYLILDEYYSFEFEQSNPGSAESWSTDNNSPAGWGITNFALDINLRLSPFFAVSMEPYLKIPVKQMGWGNVTMYSMGTLLSMKFNLN